MFVLWVKLLIMKAFTLALTLLLAVVAGAQNHKALLLRVQTSAQTAIENATVELLRAKDSALVKTTLTDKDGNAEWPTLPEGSYLVRVSGLNWEPQYSAPFQVAAGVTTHLPVMVLQNKNATQLQGVTVSAKKPFIQKLSDRIVVNVESSIVSAGSSALEVLEKAPGITIDQNDVVSLRGRQGVIIMVDGKISALSGSDLANFLRGLPAGAIERIDIITNPSSKYDAAGNSGIIDIRMKKDQRMGHNGTLTAGYGQGVYPKITAGATFNYRNKKVNVFGNYNYNYRQNFSDMTIKRDFSNNGVFSSAYDQDNRIKLPFKTQNARVGADFFPSKKTILGVVLSSNFFNVDRTNNNVATVFNQGKLPVSRFLTRARGDESFNNTVGNINFKHSFDSTGRELTADADYGVFASRGLSYNHTSYVGLDGVPFKPDYRLNGDQEGQLSIKSFKADYVHPMGKKGKLEAGFKTSFVKSDNDALFHDVSNGNPKYDSTKSNHFIYHENINAAYANWSREYGKINITLGLRAEQTNIEGHQVIRDQRFDSSYLAFFPSAFFNYKVKEDQTLGFSVSRRIDRPSYNQLNPFLFLLDISTYSTGNPYLRPQFTWSYEASYTVKGIHATLGYSHTTNNITNVVAPDLGLSTDSVKVSVQSPRNLATRNYYGLTIGAPVKITKWWNSMNNGSVFYDLYRGNVSATDLDAGQVAFNLNTNHTFTLRKGWTTELSAQYNSGSRYGFFVTQPQWQLSAGVQKQVLKGKGTLKFNVSDIFWTSIGRGTIEFRDYYERFTSRRDSRVANLAFTYRFGNSKVQQARRRSTASEEEMRRAGN